MKDVTLYAFRWVPPLAQGLVRDLRVRWALGEAGIPYTEHLVSLEESKTPAYRALQPFGQVPSAKIDGVTFFESGALVLQIAEQSAALMPDDATARALVRMWMFSALNTIEPPLTMLNVIDFTSGGPEKADAKLRGRVVGWAGERLDELTASLGGRAYIVADRFTAADLLMTTVLRILRDDDLITKRPALVDYRSRHEARPAFQKALAAQMAPFAAHAPTA